VHIRKNDVVVAVRGRDAGTGKTGKVIEVLPAKGRALVEGINLVKKCVRKSQDRPQGGIVDREAPIAVSNLMLYCPHCKKGVRARRRVEGDRRIRVCRKCGHGFDA